MLEITVEIEKTCSLGQMTLQIPEAEIENKTASGVNDFVRGRIESAIIKEMTFSFQASVGTEKNNEPLINYELVDNTSKSVD